MVFLFPLFGEFEMVSKIYLPVTKPLHWLDKHIYHIGYDPNLHQPLPSDNHFGIVFYITVIIICLIIISVWSRIDRHKANYAHLDFRFRIFIRYVLALIVFSYGIDKLVPVQMRYPSVADLVTPMGDQNLFSMLWNFVGVSPGYEMFTGFFEVTASLLLIFPRTYIFGSLLMCTVLCNVVALNIFYNIPVIMYSFLLLVCVLYLLQPYSFKLFQFFFHGRSVSLTDSEHQPYRIRKSKFLYFLGYGLVFFLFISEIVHVTKIYSKDLVQARQDKLYDVIYFIQKDTLPPLTTDTIRWKRFVMTGSHSAVIFNMQDKPDYYQFDMDSIKHTISLHDSPDTNSWKIFTYDYPQKEHFEMTGKWKGNEVIIKMKEIAVDSMYLKKEKLMFYQE
jgi:hypothetical protein